MKSGLGHVARDEASSGTMRKRLMTRNYGTTEQQAHRSFQPDRLCSMEVQKVNGDIVQGLYAEL